MSSLKELHSVYIDDELPKNFVAEYESKVKNDSKSSAELEKMKKIHDLLNFDAESESSKISDEFMQKSFERLQSKMRFTQNVQISEPKRNFSSFLKYPISFAAAAAVFAVIFVPSHIKAINSLNEKQISAISHTRLRPIAEASVEIDGNISSEKLPEVFAAVATSENNSQNSKSNSESNSDLNISVQKTVRATSVVSSSAKFNSNNFSSRMTSVDVFRPSLSDNNVNMNDIPVHDLAE